MTLILCKHFILSVSFLCKWGTLLTRFILYKSSFIDHESKFIPNFRHSLWIKLYLIVLKLPHDKFVNRCKWGQKFCYSVRVVNVQCVDLFFFSFFVVSNICICDHIMKMMRNLRKHEINITHSISMVVNIDPSLLNKHHHKNPFTMQREQSTTKYIHNGADRLTDRLKVSCVCA